MSFAGYENMRRMKKSLDDSLDFVRHVNRFSLRRDRKKQYRKSDQSDAHHLVLHLPNHELRPHELKKPSLVKRWGYWSVVFMAGLILSILMLYLQFLDIVGADASLSNFSFMLISIIAWALILGPCYLIYVNGFAGSSPGIPKTSIRHIKLERTGRENAETKTGVRCSLGGMGQDANPNS